MVRGGDKSFLCCGTLGKLPCDVFGLCLDGFLERGTANVGENEGVVFGSFVINVEKGQESESDRAFPKGRKAGDATYWVTISERGFNPLKPKYLFRATPEKEEIFIRKLPAGTYQIEKIQKEGFTILEWSLRVSFTVTPKQTTYIGKFTVQVPDRIRMGSPVRMNVADAERETTELLKNEHEKSLSNVVKALMAIQRLTGRGDR